MKPDNLKCPDCGGPMVSRLAKRNNHDMVGQRFWGCAKFPQCRGTRNTDGESRAERRPRPADDDASE